MRNVPQIVELDHEVKVTLVAAEMEKASHYCWIEYSIRADRCADRNNNRQQACFCPSLGKIPNHLFHSGCSHVHRCLCYRYSMMRGNPVRACGNCAESSNENTGLRAIASNTERTFFDPNVRHQACPRSICVEH